MAEQEGSGLPSEHQNSDESQGCALDGEHFRAHVSAHPLSSAVSHQPLDILFQRHCVALQEVHDLKTLVKEMDNKCTRLEMKYRHLAHKVDLLERCSTDATKSLCRATQRNNDLTEALKSIVLDIGVGHCNNCGSKFDHDDEASSPYILEKCGAPWCHQCVRKKKGECVHHSGLGVQQSHRIYSTSCLICHRGQSQALIDISCGHPVCRECLKTWLSLKYQMGRDDVVHSTAPSFCPLCQDRQRSCDLFILPSLRHETSYERAKAYAARQR